VRPRGCCGWDVDIGGSKDNISRNTFKDIEYITRTLGEAHGTRFEFECYDVDHLFSVLAATR
jgi:uncharacterized protein (DUF849 family)